MLRSWNERQVLSDLQCNRMRNGTDLDVHVGRDGLVVGVDHGAVLDQDAVGGRLKMDGDLLQGGSARGRHLASSLFSDNTFKQSLNSLNFVDILFVVQLIRRQMRTEIS